MPRSAAAEVRARPGRRDAQDVDRHVGVRVRERRVALGLTQQRLAELIGTTYQQAHKYERGLNRVSAGRLHLLARALKVEPGYFFEGLGGSEPARPNPQQRLLLELARSFTRLPRRQQEALAEMARVLAGAEAGPRQEEAGDATRTTGAPALPSSEAA